jgi:hypothetical protein
LCVDRSSFLLRVFSSYSPLEFPAYRFARCRVPFPREILPTPSFIFPSSEIDFSVPRGSLLVDLSRIQLDLDKYLDFSDEQKRAVIFLFPRAAPVRLSLLSQPVSFSRVKIFPSRAAALVAVSHKEISLPRLVRVWVSVSHFSQGFHLPLVWFSRSIHLFSSSLPPVSVRSLCPA